MAKPIPPKGRTSMEVLVRPVPHGAEVVVRVRSLRLAAAMKGDVKISMLYAWYAIGTELTERGIDLRTALTTMPDPIERMDLGDG